MAQAKQSLPASRKRLHEERGRISEFPDGKFQEKSGRAETIPRRTGKRVLWGNPSVSAKPAQMMNLGGLRPSKPPKVSVWQFGMP
jgi:hypothetical protein